MCDQGIFNFLNKPDTTHRVVLCDKDYTAELGYMTNTLVSTCTSLWDKEHSQTVSVIK